MTNETGNLSFNEYQVANVSWPNTSREIAYELLTFDISPLPVKPRSKEVATFWKRFQGAGPSLLHFADFFKDEDRNVAAMCGPPSKNLFVIDAESRGTLDKWLKMLDYPDTWIVETRRGGHIYLRSPFPVAYRKLPDAEIRGANSYVLAPGSIHPSGKRYRFINFAHQILALTDEDIQNFPVPLARGEFHGNLPKLARGLMRTSGDCGYGGRGRKEFTIVMSLMGAGFNDEMIFALFEDYLYVGNKFRERGPEYLKQILRKARKLIGQNEEQKHRIFVAGYAFAQEYEWPNKRTATTDKNVYAAHLMFARQFGRLQNGGRIEYGASERELAERAGYGRQTVSKATKRLKEIGLVALEKPANYSLSSRFSLNTEVFKTVPLADHSHKKNTGVCEWPLMEPNHDVWRTRSGPTKHLIYQTLMANAGRLRFREIVDKTGKPKNTLSRNLNQMVEMGLLDKKMKHYCIIQNVSLDEIAKKIGTHGKAEKQKARHRMERILQSKRLTQHDNKYSNPKGM